MPDPSVRTVSKWPPHDVTMLSDDDDILTDMRVGEEIFIANKDINLDNPPATGDLYWKGVIDSMHRIPKKKGCMFIVKWFYSKEDVVTLLKMDTNTKVAVDAFGEHELTLSDHKDVIDSLTCQSDIIVHVFNDNDYLREHIEKGWWYQRIILKTNNPSARVKGVNLHCTCQTPYNPNVDIQRFCIQCSHWYDADCLRRASDGSVLPFTRSESILVKVAKMPIIRGCLKGQDNWSLVGSGPSVVKAKEWVHALETDDNFILPPEWRDQLVKNLLDFVADTTFTTFPCPECGEDTLI
ncbi:hypothetical protein BDN70DRAFT_939693 [Pholiota conissans]|uniref:BAH domain-containing protein n=1 Tax=Pholiota conissans TaxID=109636 RepID=A0A9P5YID5_9AGAR|nr:hypothetical protein BDN70DRAFT_939693 [Pholiota conissans]